MTEPKAKLTVSVIMPALNEEANIADAIRDTLAGMDEFGVQGEIIVVNDGSRDRTAEIVAEIMHAEPRVRVLTHDAPWGFGNSFWDGVDHSTADVVVVLPGDNENIPTEIFRYFDLLEHVDIVIPFLFNRETRSPIRNIISYLYRAIINTSFFVNLNYTNGTVLYRRNILAEMSSRSGGFFFQTEILVTAIKQGYLFAEVPYRVGTREGGKSTAVKFPSFVGVVKGYLSLMWDVWMGKRPELSKNYFAGSATCIRRRQK